MVRERKLSFYVCYPVEVEKNVDGDWYWKYVGDEIKHVTKILNVKKSISFDELYDEVKGELEIGTMLYDFQMKVMVPISKAKPMLLDCDKVVTRFFGVCDQKKEVILVNLKEKENGTHFEAEATHYEHGIGSQETRELVYLMGTQETSVQMDVGENNEVNERFGGIATEERFDSRESVEKVLSSSEKLKKLSAKIDGLPDIMKEIAKEDDEKEKRHLRRTTAKKERLESCPPRLGKRKFEPAPMQVVLSDEITQAEGLLPRKEV